ncbi:MAG TPA: hypothetical protein VIH88_00985 [Candidatus Acidoferrales bacterium]
MYDGRQTAMAFLGGVGSIGLELQAAPFRGFRRAAGRIAYAKGRGLNMQDLRSAITVSALLLAGVLMGASGAHAQIVSIANNQGQSGTCTSGVGPGGTLCATSTTPFLLSDLENGTEVLTIPNTSSTPVFYVEDNLPGTLSSLSLIFDGSLASNANLQCNFGGGESGLCNVDGVSGGLSNPIPAGDFPATITFSGISIPDGTFFEIGTASFAHAGQDFGCLAGTPIAPGSSGGTSTCTPVAAPEPSTPSMLLLAGLLFGAWIGFRQILALRS